MRLTQAVCEDGMPPDPTTRVKSHLRSLYQKVKTLSSWAMANATKAAMKGLQPHSIELIMSCIAILLSSIVQSHPFQVCTPMCDLDFGVVSCVK